MLLIADKGWEYEDWIGRIGECQLRIWEIGDEVIALVTQGLEIRNAGITNAAEPLWEGILESYPQITRMFEHYAEEMSPSGEVVTEVFLQMGVANLHASWGEGMSYAEFCAAFGIAQRRSDGDVEANIAALKEGQDDS